ncbi:MAG: 50S ribosomal protein L7 [Lawsonibacter sp.]|nr:50S ribosomal protein L7 [Lawsonibacter sp.]
MTNDPVLHLLGLAKKAGRLEIGEEPVGAVCRSRQARVVLLAADAAPNTRRRAAHFGEAGNVLWIETPFDKAALGFVLGRSSCAMLALTDAGFAAAVGEKLAVRDPDKYGPAARQLRTKADRVLQRQKEQRQHEKKLRQGRQKPWAPLPAKEERPPSQRGRPGEAQAARSPKARRRPREEAPPPQRDKTVNRGPGGRRLTGKFRHS